VTGNPNPLLAMFTIVIVLEALFGMSTATLWSGELRGASWLKRVVVCGVFALSVIGNGLLFYWLTNGGSDEYLAQTRFHTSKSSSALLAPNPAAPGPFAIETIFYGSGTDRQRPEFGPDVALKTTSVDGSFLLPFWQGYKATVRQWYWGFGPTELPLNGRVWYPKGAGPFPLVVIAHGNHAMEEPSDAGYAYLGELLASRGYIAVAVDENFFNVSWSGDWQGRTMAARAWLLLQHLKLWRSWNESTANPFYHKIALDRIALVGHSRGGEAVAVAALFNRLSHCPEDARLKFDFHFDIRTVVALAPTADYYTPAGQPLTLTDVNYLLMHGGHDSDVAVFLGSRQYQRVKFTGTGNWHKASIYLYRANHSQFNTLWGDADWSQPFGVLLNRKPLLTGEEQRQIAKTYVSAFLEATLREQHVYWPLFRSQQAKADWLPETISLQQYQASDDQVLSNYEEDVDVATASVPGTLIEGLNLQVWREAKLLLRLDEEANQANNIVRLEWLPGAPPAFYRFTLPERLAANWKLDETARLTLALANDSATRQPIELMIELVDVEGQRAQLPLHQFAALNPPLPIRLAKLPALEAWLLKPAELVPQTIELPLAEFVRVNPLFKPGNLATITLQLDRRTAGAVVLDEVGFSREH
jgi:dienelactone hydrolase